MNSFILALQFLTIVPVRVKSAPKNDMAWSLVYFPIIGFFIGLVLSAIYFGQDYVQVNGLSKVIILIVSLIFVTGGLHLDGLADTADAFLSGRNREEKLRIMRDPHIGVMGVAALISVILLKIAFLFSIQIKMWPVVMIVMCVVSRWAMVFMMYYFPYARDDGKAKIFIEGLNSKIFILSTIVMLICAFMFLHLKGVILAGIVSAGVFVLGRIMHRVLGGITGDTIGAVNELAEVFVLFFVVIFDKVS